VSKHADNADEVMRRSIVIDKTGGGVD